MPRLLIVSHVPSVNTRAMTDAVVSGASHEDITGVDLRVRTPFAAGAEDVLWPMALSSARPKTSAT